MRLRKKANYIELKAKIINQKEYEESLNNTIKIDTEDTPSHAKIIEDAIRETGKKPLNLRDYQAKAKAYNVQRNTIRQSGNKRKNDCRTVKR